MRSTVSNSFFRIPFQLAFVLCLAAAAGSLSCSRNSSKSTPNADKSNFVLKKPDVDPSVPFAVSTKKEDETLCAAIDSEINARDQKSERWGLVIVSLKDGRALCTKNGRQLFTPASVQKLLTATVALDKLGPGFKPKTSLYTSSEPSQGKIEGDLVLYGRGAADLNRDSLSRLVAALRKKGVTEIKGDVVGDESYFKGDGLGDGWAWNEAQWYYGAAASALSYERNQIEINIQNGKPESDSEFVEMSGELKPVEKIEAVGIKRKLGTNSVYVWGNGKNLKARIAVTNPALFTARVFKEMLEKNGIRVDGEARSADWTKPSDAKKGIELASIEGEPLSASVRSMNKDSVNLIAELILRSLGKTYGPEAPDKDEKMNMLRGDDQAGSAVIAKWLSDKKIGNPGMRVRDGSGLSTLDRVTPETVVRILIAASASKYSEDFIESLPIASTDGTLRGRLGGLSGKVAAKTGSIQYTNALAGFARTPDDTLAFAIFCNDETTRNDSAATIDNIVRKMFGK